MILSDDQILQKYAKQCLSCNRKGLLPYQYEWSCYFCKYNIIKQKHELTLSQRKKLTFASRIKYAEQKLITIAIEIIQIYDGEDYNKMFEVLSQIKKKKLNIKKDFIKYYNEMDSNYQQTQISLSQKNIYKISCESIRLMKFLCQKDYTSNINYHDFMASVLYALIFTTKNFNSIN